MSSPAVIVRQAATKEDAGELLRLIQQLAEFEELAPPDEKARARFVHDGFERNPPRFQAYLAGIQGEEPCAYAIFFETYSTFLCLSTLYLEDLFILPERRKHGIGKAMMKRLVREAVDRGCGRVEWHCLDWNTNAQEFYGRVGAEHLTEWLFYRMDEAAMARYVE
jgi:GNAT superfamily N-acetyltransferase